MRKILLLLMSAGLVQANAQSLGFGGPVSALVYRSDARGITPILGVPGGSYLGETTAAELDWAWVSPNRKLAFGVHEGQLCLIRDPGGNPVPENVNLPCSLMVNNSQTPVLGSPRQMATSQMYSPITSGVNVNVCSWTQAMLYKGARIPTLTAKYSSSSSVPGQFHVRVAVQRATSTLVNTGASIRTEWVSPLCHLTCEKEKTLRVCGQ